MKRPEGWNGHPDCPLCKGRGGTDEAQPIGPPAFIPCKCTWIKERNAHLENAWKGLSRAKRIDSSPLIKYKEADLWIHAPIEVFKRHLKFVANKMPLKWFFRVETDSSVVGAWLGNLMLKGQEIYDEDAVAESKRYFAIRDLTVPPDLLILRVGVKHAKNTEAAGAFHEALAEREHEGKPTWVVDDPEEPWSPDLIIYSDKLNSLFCSWPKLNIKGEAPPKPSIKIPGSGFHTLSLADDGEETSEDPRVSGKRQTARNDPLAQLRAIEKQAKDDDRKKRGGRRR